MTGSGGTISGSVQLEAGTYGPVCMARHVARHHSSGPASRSSWPRLTAG